ncbi:GGDEF domain-containing protein [Persicimonas caeni]|uniref:GGDEF domain-containing protein n=2 Tax=Persicimonas caeni TaxID=2292766 RepID=A0A4Y6PU82_PERCE|nr:GGDEF domain-containing protein [Persicimonas caeni]QED33103.1 GGDEF domain-containing protein [Persicimonas caeni]
MSDQNEQGFPAGGADLSEPSETTMIVNSEMLQQARQGLNERDQAYLIVISGPHVGRMYKVDQNNITMGRSPKVDLQLNDVGVSRQHARIVHHGDDVFVEDLQSANGTYINGRRVTSEYQLQDGDKITLGTTTILKFTYHDKLDEDFQRQMFDAALRDGLTGAYNKKYMMNHLRSELSYALRHGTHLSMLMFDVDHFKNTNDTYGHLAGDRILAKLSELAMQSIRNEDTFARYGGEEFAIICRGIAIDQCARLGNRIRKLVEQTDFIYEGQNIPVTISVGVSGVPGVQARAPEDLIGAADEALYAAKNAGRNRVMVKRS